jgi:hypothetical protein
MWVNMFKNAEWWADVILGATWGLCLIILVGSAVSWFFRKTIPLFFAVVLLAGCREKQTWDGVMRTTWFHRATDGIKPDEWGKEQVDHERTARGWDAETWPAPNLYQGARRNGVIVASAPVSNTVIRIGPSLCFSDEWFSAPAIIVDNSVDSISFVRGTDKVGTFEYDKGALVFRGDRKKTMAVLAGLIAHSKDFQK